MYFPTPIDGTTFKFVNKNLGCIKTSTYIFMAELCAQHTELQKQGTHTVMKY